MRCTGAWRSRSGAAACCSRGRCRCEGVLPGFRWSCVFSFDDVSELIHECFAFFDGVVFRETDAQRAVERFFVDAVCLQDVAFLVLVAGSTLGQVDVFHAQDVDQVVGSLSFDGDVEQFLLG